MKPNFETMTKAELRVYVLEHRDDLDALEALFSRRSPDSEAILFYPPQTEAEWQQWKKCFAARLIVKKTIHNAARSLYPQYKRHRIFPCQN